jgi:hypothetical protein
VRDTMLDKASPPDCLFDVWNYYWLIRRGETLLCSEILAYKELTNAEIDAYEVNMMLYIDDCVNNRIAYYRKQK